MIRNKILMIAVGSVAALTGCTSMNGDYDCPIKSRPSCISLRDMDRSLNKDVQNKEALKVTSNVIHRDRLPMSFPTRTKDLTAKIWLAPYEDNNGNYHEAGYMYTVVENATWHGAPVKVS